MTDANDHDHDHAAMTPEQLVDHNIAELSRGINDLIIHNESRMALIRNSDNPWIELQFEMVSFKLDILVDLLVAGTSPTPALRIAELGMDFQLRLSRLLDTLFPHTAPQPARIEE